MREASNAKTGGVLTNMVGISQSKGFVKKKIPVSLEAMAVSFSESVGELFLTDFMVALSVGKQKIETHGGRQKKENRIQNFEVESRK